MKKVVFILAIFSALLFAFVSCNKENTTLYEGTYIKGNAAECQNIVTITRSIPDGLPLNTSFYVTFTDSTLVKKLKDKENIQFKMIKYNRDTIGHFANCLWADYDATIEWIR
jgi:hypothetical protein